MKQTKQLLLINCVCVILMLLAGCVTPAYEQEVWETKSSARLTHSLTQMNFGSSLNLYLPQGAPSPNILSTVGDKSSSRSNYERQHTKIFVDRSSDTTMALTLANRKKDIPKRWGKPGKQKGSISESNTTTVKLDQPYKRVVVSHIYPHYNDWRVMIKDVQLGGYKANSLDTYGGLYDKVFASEFTLEISDVKEKATSWVFRCGIQEVWKSLMDVVCQYHGILALTQFDNSRLVVCRRVLALPIESNDTSPRYEAVAMAIVAVEAEPNLTVVYCTPLNSDGTVKSLSSRQVLSIPQREASHGVVEVTNYPKSIEVSRTDFSSYLLEEIAKIKDKKKKDKNKDSTIESEVIKANIQAICVHRFYQELAVQIFAPQLWQKKYNSVSGQVSSKDDTRNIGRYENVLHYLKKRDKIYKEYIDVAAIGGDAYGQSILCSSIQIVAPSLEGLLCEIVMRLQERYKEMMPAKSTTFCNTARVYIIASPDIQAFALPDGRIFICAGLLDVLDDQGELAALLAHELSHVVCHDMAAQLLKKTENRQLAETVAFGAQIGINVAYVASTASAASSAASSGTSVAPSMTNQMVIQAIQGAALGLVSSGMQLYDIAVMEGFSQEAELFADEFAVTLLSSSGYAPESMVSLLQNLQTQKTKSDTKKEKIDEQKRLISNLINAKPGIAKRLDHVRKLLDNNK